MGWLSKLTDWLRDQIIAFFHGLQLLLEAIFMFWVHQMASVWLTLLELLPVPDFLAGYSLCTLLSQTGPTVGWALNTFRIGEGLGLIAAAYAFRFTRKLLTFFQW
ncbi:phage coat protein [Lysobacter capsici]|uniref:phage coat protein n=1 Tax=Lysobacter capsici TaxID=435897 RepID=UPI00287B8D7A|nr:phage coat protein [Lysobacter capsici]WND83115.1 phage coat protein [Lysobacter capsici]WND88314.1 phage coat protein [Lysobacter capsici]